MPTIEKQRRMDLRLTERQRLTYERAAALRGQTLTQWATAHLDESSARDIAEASTTYLSPDGFDAFCEMLDSPMPQAAKALLDRKAIWEWARLPSPFNSPLVKASRLSTAVIPL